MEEYNSAGKFYRKRMGEEVTYVTLCLDVVDLMKGVDPAGEIRWLADCGVGFEESTEEWWREKGGVEGFKVWKREMDALGVRVLEECRSVLLCLCKKDSSRWRSVYQESLRGDVGVVLKRIGEVMRES